MENKTEDQIAQDILEDTYVTNQENSIGQTAQDILSETDGGGKAPRKF